MSKKYVIDACALINASKNYNMTKKAFSHIWQAFNELVENGQLISSSEIFEEVKVEAVRILQEFVQGKILKENRKKLYSFRFSFCL